MADEPDAPDLRIKVLGVEYPFPSFDTLSYKEARRIKKETGGLVMGEFYKALEKGDPDALLAVALIAKLRDNPSFDADELSDLMLADIEIVVPPAAAEDPSSPLAELDSEGDTSDSLPSNVESSLQS